MTKSTTILDEGMLLEVQEDYCIGGSDEPGIMLALDLLGRLRSELWTHEDPREEPDKSGWSAERVMGECERGHGALAGWWVADVTRHGCRSSRIIFRKALAESPLRGELIGAIGRSDDLAKLAKAALAMGILSLDRPCGCHAHPREPLTGHPYCDQPDPVMLALESEGIVERTLEGSAWRWGAIGSKR